jgi:hypothetical protein
MTPHVAEWRSSVSARAVDPETMSPVADVPANVKRPAMVLVTTLHVVGLPLSATLLGRAPATMQHVVETRPTARRPIRIETMEAKGVLLLPVEEIVFLAIERCH